MRLYTAFDLHSSSNYPVIIDPGLPFRQDYFLILNAREQSEKLDPGPSLKPVMVFPEYLF